MQIPATHWTTNHFASTILGRSSNASTVVDSVKEVYLSGCTSLVWGGFFGRFVVFMQKKQNCCRKNLHISFFFRNFVPEICVYCFRHGK